MSISRDDIHRVIYELKASGRSVADLQCLSIHDDDLIELLQSIPEANNGMGFDSIKLFGIKIISSKWAQKGTICKIFKTNGPFDTEMWSSEINQPNDLLPFEVLDKDDEEHNNTENKNKKNKIKIKKKRKHSTARKIYLD